MLAEDLALGYLYGVKFQGSATALIQDIRKEIYDRPYDSIDFARYRNDTCEEDQYNPIHQNANTANKLAVTYESIAIPFIRKKALDKVHQLIVYEDDNTNSQCIAAVSKALHMVCRFITDGPDSEAFKRHVAKIDDFLWMSHEGMMMTGTNGSQLWDLAFLAQAVVEGGLAEEKENRECCIKALDWLDKAQIRQKSKWYKEAYRHGSRGAWPFSMPEQSYTVSRLGYTHAVLLANMSLASAQVSDCTGEGLKAVLALQSARQVSCTTCLCGFGAFRLISDAASFIAEAVDASRLEDSVDLLLTMQNPNGGFASYELVRGNRRLEWLNTSEVFGTFRQVGGGLP